MTDWFESQNIVLTQTDANGNPISLEWDQLADAPGTSSYAAARGGRFDEVHVVVIDAKGTVSGNAGTVLENLASQGELLSAENSSAIVGPTTCGEPKPPRGEPKPLQEAKRDPGEFSPFQLNPL